MKTCSGGKRGRKAEREEKNGMDTKRKGLIGLPLAGQENEAENGKTKNGTAGGEKETFGHFSDPARKKSGGKKTVLLILLAAVLLAAGLPALIRAGITNRKSGTENAQSGTRESAETSAPDIGPAAPDGQKTMNGNGASADPSAEENALVLLPEPDAGQNQVTVDIRPKEEKEKSEKPEVSSSAIGSDRDGKRKDGAVIRLEPETSLTEEDGETPVTGNPADLRPAVQPGSDNPFEDGNGAEEDSDLPEKDGKALFGEDRPGEGNHF